MREHLIGWLQVVIVGSLAGMAFTLALGMVGMLLTAAYALLTGGLCHA